MRSIPLAMTRELLLRGRWQFLLALLGANLFPFLLVAVLRLAGTVEAAEPSVVIMQMIIVQLLALILAMGPLSGYEFTRQNYALPVTTTTLVAWRLLPSMAVVFVESVFSLSMLNLVFGLQWPVWGPSLFAAVGVAAIMATLWWSANSIYLPLNIGLTATGIGLWYKSRHGLLFSPPEHMWFDVTTTDLLTLALFALTSLAIAVKGVSRRRCGDFLGSADAMAALERAIENWFSLSGRAIPFRSAIQAQVWRDWTQKGRLLPAVTLFGLLAGFGGWMLFSRQPADLIKAFIAGGWILAGLGAVGGMIIGNCGSSDANTDMGNFLATRPISNRDLSTTVLLVTFRSTLYSWLIWALMFLLSIGSVFAFGDRNDLAACSQLNWWYLPATLLGFWTVVSVFTSIYLSGHIGIWMRGAAILFGLLLAQPYISTTLDQQTRDQFRNLVMTLTGLAVSGTVLALMLIAWRKSAIDVAGLVVTGCVWFALSLLAVRECWQPSALTSMNQGAISCLMIGVAGLCVLPFSAAPLAVAWNRHR